MFGSNTYPGVELKLQISEERWSSRTVLRKHLPRTAPKQPSVLCSLKEDLGLFYEAYRLINDTHVHIRWEDDGHAGS